MPGSILQDARFVSRNEGALVVDLGGPPSAKRLGRGVAHYVKRIGKINSRGKKENKVWAKKGHD